MSLHLVERRIAGAPGSGENLGRALNAEVLYCNHDGIQAAVLDVMEPSACAASPYAIRGTGSSGRWKLGPCHVAKFRGVRHAPAAQPLFPAGIDWLD